MKTHKTIEKTGAVPDCFQQEVQMPVSLQTEVKEDSSPSEEELVQVQPKQWKTFKSRQHRPNWKIKKFLTTHDSLPMTEREADRKGNQFTIENIKTWRKKKARYLAEGGSRPTCKNRKSVEWLKKQKMGRFADEEKVLHQEYKRRRAQGMVVDYEWL